MSIKDFLFIIVFREEVEVIKNYVLEIFYFILFVIDFYEFNVYDVKDDIGFWEGYFYFYFYILYLLDKVNL